MNMRKYVVTLTIEVDDEIKKENDKAEYSDETYITQELGDFWRSFRDLTVVSLEEVECL